MPHPLFRLSPDDQRNWLVQALARPAPPAARNLSDGFRLPGREGTPTPAAVLVPLVNRPIGLQVLLTQRSAEGRLLRVYRRDRTVRRTFRH